MHNLIKDPFEENLGTFLNSLLKDAIWESNTTSAKDLLYMCEVSVPIVIHYTDPMVAEGIAVVYEKFLREWYDKLEVSAMELAAGKTMVIDRKWKQAPDRMTQLFLKYMTDPTYRDYVNADYSKQEEAFGEKIMQCWASAAITQLEDGRLFLMFCGWVMTATQDKEDIYHYKKGIALETIS